MVIFSPEPGYSYVSIKFEPPIFLEYNILSILNPGLLFFKIKFLSHKMKQRDLKTRYTTIYQTNKCCKSIQGINVISLGYK